MNSENPDVVEARRLWNDYEQYPASTEAWVAFIGWLQSGGLYGACDRSGFSNRREPTVSTTSPPAACSYCGNPHTLERCPRIRSIEYHPQLGGIKKLEFFEPSPLRSYVPRYDAKPTDHPFDTGHTTAGFGPSQARRSWPAQIQLCPETLRAIVTAFGGDPLKIGDRTEWTASHRGDGKY